MIIDLSGKVALVTGGNRGIGRACVLALAEAGAEVIATVRREEDGIALVEEMNALHLGSVTHKLLDVSEDEILLKAAFAEAMPSGGIDILVNNAGITGDDLFIRQSTENWDAVLNTNLRGAYFCTQAAWKFLKKRNGCVINMSSVVARYPNISQSIYAITKAGLEAMTRNLTQESKGAIRVNAVAPGFIETDMTMGLNDEIRHNALSRIALGRLGTPADVAHAVVFLASPLASYINGQVIGVDGGMF